MNNLDVSIQIVNYNTKKYLIECIDGVLAGLKDSGLNYKIVVLDNASQDDLSDMWSRYDEQVVWYDSEKNLGFGGGHNLLAQKTDSNYIFVLNPDTQVEGDTIKVLFDFMEMHATAGMCGPRVFLPEKNFFFHKMVFWPKKFTLKEFFERFLKIRIMKKIMFLEHDPIIGAALFIRRDAFRKVGGFDENLFLYFEEGDLCNSLKKAGYKIFFIYNALVTHLYGKSDVSKKGKVEEFKKSRRYFYKKWYGEEKAKQMLALQENPVNDKYLEKVL